MNYRFFTLSSHAWDAMLKAIKGAKKSIYWESYILSDDTDTHNFFGALKQKAVAGVRVKIIVDSLGSFWLSSEAIQKLKDSGAEVLFYNRLLPWWNPYRLKHWWFNRNHKKMLIVDEEVAFVGGVNVAKRSSNWLDLHVELRGVIVRYIIRSFAASYELCGGKDKIKYRGVLSKSKIKIFHHSPLTDKEVLRKYYKISCLNAKKSIVIATPYFVPPAWLMRCLRGAVRRGVRVELIIPKKTDYWLATLANYTLISLIYRPGMNFFLTESMIHAKAFLVDGKEGLIGSQNIDAFSFDYNLESGIMFQRKDMVKDLKEIFDGWKKDSEEMVFQKEGRKWYWRLGEAIFLALRPYL